MLAAQPLGAIDANTFRLELVDRAPLRDGEARISPLYLSLDPAMRSWLDDRTSYVPLVGLGEVMRTRGVGRVVESRSSEPTPAIGTVVVGQLGW